MGEQQNLDVVKRGYEAFGRGDINGLLTLLDDNIEWITPGPADLPTAGRRVGPARVAEFFQALTSVVETLRFEPKQFLAQGESVVVIGDDTSRVKATGKTLEFDWVHVFTVRNGKVVRLQEYGDTTPLVAELRAAQARA